MYPPKQPPNDTEETHVPHILLGDDAFPLGCHLMRPFARNALTNERCILQLQIVKDQKSSGKCFWYIGQLLEDLSLPHLFKS